MTAWIGVDLDGTLAYTDYHSTGQPHGIGEPIPVMVDRVKQWVAEGKKVKIVTARAAPPFINADFELVGKQAVLLEVKEWLKNHLGFELEVTAEKDYHMIELWDDRAVQVIPNTGERVDGKYN